MKGKRSCCLYFNWPAFLDSITLCLLLNGMTSICIGVQVMKSCQKLDCNITLGMTDHNIFLKFNQIGLWPNMKLIYQIREILPCQFFRNQIFMRVPYSKFWRAQKKLIPEKTVCFFQKVDFSTIGLRLGTNAPFTVFEPKTLNNRMKRVFESFAVAMRRFYATSTW